MGIITKATDKFQNCLDSCVKCTQACYECFDACLEEPDLKKRKNCVSILVDCGMMCQMAITLMSKNDQYAFDFCELCGKVCAKCAQECAMFEDEHSRKCAEICKTCSEECIKISSM